MRRALPVIAALLSAFAAIACTQKAPPPLGEALVVVQTDVAVPRRVNRLRVEFIALDGRILDTREVVTPSADDWPVSFSAVLPENAGESDVILRLRAFPEGHEVSARELERLSREPPRNPKVHATIEEACATAPTLKLAQPITMRRGSKNITTLLRAQGCNEDTLAGSVVAKLEIVERGDYEIEIVRAVPDSSNAEPGSDTAIALRRDCVQGTTQIACADQISNDNRLSRLDRVTLDPGTYFVVTGGADPAPADLTLVASRLDVFQPAPPAPPPLVADPALLEPAPGVTIDRLVGIHLYPGERGNLHVTLHGECFGTPADVAGRLTCVDKPSERAPLSAESPAGKISRTADPVTPWSGDRPEPCASTPREGEVCVPGSAFILGDTLALEDLDRQSQPERMRVVEPFFIDKQEMTVGRFRAALARGFVPPDKTPFANAEPALARDKPFGMCTWSVAPGARESYPLNCVTWITARALCNFLESDLPTEDQWELAATSAGRDVETPYPWGRELPDCGRTVFGRTKIPTAPCPDSPLGPVPVDDTLLANGDVTPLGIVGLAGNLEEMLATPFIAYSDPAWARAGLRSAVDEPEAPLRSARGADWSVGSLYATASTRRSEPVISAFDNVGFRCARKGR